MSTGSGHSILSFDAPDHHSQDCPPHCPPQVQNICTSQGWLGNLVDVFSNFDEDALGRCV